MECEAIRVLILLSLPFEDVLKCTLLNHLWRQTVRSKELWWALYIRDFESNRKETRYVALRNQSLRNLAFRVVKGMENVKSLPLQNMDDFVSSFPCAYNYMIRRTECRLDLNVLPRFKYVLLPVDMAKVTWDVAASAFVVSSAVKYVMHELQKSVEQERARVEELTRPQFLVNGQIHVCGSDCVSAYPDEENPGNFICPISGMVIHSSLLQYPRKAAAYQEYSVYHECHHCADDADEEMDDVGTGADPEDACGPQWMKRQRFLWN